MATGGAEFSCHFGAGFSDAEFSSPNATDETHAGERGVSPFELRKMLSGEGTYDLGHIPRVVLWRVGKRGQTLMFVVN